MAMLVLAQASIPDCFQVATVDHGLRPENADEARSVARYCEMTGVPHRTLEVEVEGGNLQSQARLARYQALADWSRENDLRAILTAHHADDQAETLLMRLNRGSGVAGLAGVRASGSFAVGAGDLAVLRPLLGFRRAELQSVVAAAGINPAEDASNSDERFDRVRIRKAIEGADWLDPVALARSAANLADADEALDHFAELAWVEAAQRDGDAILVAPIGLRAVALRVLARVFENFGGQPRGSELARLLERLEAGEGANLAGIIARVENDGAGSRRWRFEPEPPRKTG